MGRWPLPAHARLAGHIVPLPVPLLLGGGAVRLGRGRRDGRGLWRGPILHHVHDEPELVEVLASQKVEKVRNHI